MTLLPNKTPVILSWDDISALASVAALRLYETDAGNVSRLYGVPRGGIHAAQAISRKLVQMKVDSSMVEHWQDATHIIDDLIDSGETKRRHSRSLLGRDIPFIALYQKQPQDGWVSFPWERMQGEKGPSDAITRILQYIGEDPNRDGLKETPSRVIKSYSEIFSGYSADEEALFKTFEETSDEMVIVRNLEIFSMCEHHMLPFYGKCHIAYLPKNRVIGLSKLARLMEVYARRLQVQERLTQQITASIDKHLQPLGSACVIEAKHLCMCARGVGKQHSDMVTSSLTGKFRQPEVRSEFLSLINNKQ